MSKNIYYNRLKEFWESMGYSNANSFGIDIANIIAKMKGKKPEDSEKDKNKNKSWNITRLKNDEKAKIGVDLVLAIERKFPDINTNWLLFGKGEMFLSEISEVNEPQISDYKATPTSPEKNTCNNPACIAEKNKLKDDKIALLEEINQLRKEKEEQKGVSPPGKKSEGGVEEPLKNGTDG